MCLLGRSLRTAPLATCSRCRRRLQHRRERNSLPLFTIRRRRCLMQPKLSHTPTCDVFQIEKVNPLPVGSTTVFIDSAASSHMVSADSRISQHVVETSDCNVRIKGSCGTSSAMKEGTLKFGICNAQNKISPVALEVLLVTCDLPSTPPVLRHGTNYVPISTKVPRMYVVNIILDDCLLYTSPSPRDLSTSRMPSSA